MVDSRPSACAAATRSAGASAEAIVADSIAARLAVAARAFFSVIPFLPIFTIRRGAHVVPAGQVHATGNRGARDWQPLANE
jgi:hypothetical protein